MGSDIFSLPEEHLSALLFKASELTGLSEKVLEKDLWVCWLLEQLFSLEIPMCFKGGTSLSKAYGLIKRFSEDLDITIDYLHFFPDVEIQSLSRSQLKKLSDQLKEKLKVCISEEVIPVIKDLVSAKFPEFDIQIELNEEGDQLYFYYPSLHGPGQYYLRDHVLLEFGMRNSVEPSDVMEIEPYLTGLSLGSLVFPKARVNTLSPIRTFWEKATLIHVECHRDRLTQSPERLSRHWYDLYVLSQSWVGEEAIKAKDVLESVLDYKRAFFNASYANYDKCSEGEFRLLPIEESGIIALQKDYQKMIEAGMFHGEPPDFSEIRSELSELERRINS